jgi:bifunctional non-homologous end joining protein LigD
MAAVNGDNRSMSGAGEQREGLTFTHLDEELFDGAGATKRDLIDYVDAMSARLVTSLRDRPLSVVRIRPGQPAFMQKNLPSYTPDWVQRVPIWAEASRREVSYALANDRRTLLWFANQRAVEYHVTLFQIDHPDRPEYLVLDLDPPEGAAFPVVIQAAQLIRQALADVGLSGVVKTSGAKGVHVFVPLANPVSHDDAAAATRAVAARAEQIDSALATTAFVKEDRIGKVFLDSTRAGGATVVAAYSPRIRPGVPVSFPLAWPDLDRITPADFTIRTAVALLGDADPWIERMPEAQRLSADLIAEGHTIPIARVQAMHEGKRRARRAARDS